MPIVVVTQPTDGSSADAADVNNQINAILAVLNGFLDTDNFGSLPGTKLIPGSVPFSALDSTTQSALGAGWNPLGSIPNSVTYNGNRSYQMVFNGTDLTGKVNPGTRLMTTRSVAAPTQSTSLNGTNQYYSKASPAGMTFTNNFVVSAWIKLSSYQNGTIAARFLGTGGGFVLEILGTGQLRLVGYNTSSANFSYVVSTQSVPINKWTHVTAQLDMASFTATPTTSYTMIDGVDVPATVARAGTNPTSLTQAGNLEIGANNTAATPLIFFSGKIAQVAIFNTKVTQATMQSYMSQSYTGNETNLTSAYSFNNTINDLNTTNANNLTANGSAVATNADSPFGTQASGLINSTLDYGIVQSAVFSTNTTLVVQVPEGCTIPTSGGVSAVSYSGIKAPYGFPVQKDKWRISTLIKTTLSTTNNASYGTFINNGYKISVPIGSWEIGQQSGGYIATVDTFFNLSPISIIGLSAVAGASASPLALRTISTSGTIVAPGRVSQTFTLSIATVYIMYTLGSSTTSGIAGDITLSELFAENSYV